MPEATGNPFDKAIEVIREQGWGQEESYSQETGTVCLLGAMRASLDSAWLALSKADGYSYPYPLPGDVLDILWGVIPAPDMRGRSTRFTSASLACWNDCDDRTEAEVIEALQHASDVWEETHA